MKKCFTPAERDAFAKAVSAVEGIQFSQEDNVFFESLLDSDSLPQVLIQRVLTRALEKA